MSKGGSPMGSGGFGGQQQQGGFGGGFGMPQQQQGGFGGGFGGQQGFSGGFQPSRQRFNQMPQQQGFGGGFGGGFGMPQQQQGFGNTFARTMPPQQGFGPGINNYAGPQQPQGFGGQMQGFGGFDMFPQQQQQQQQRNFDLSGINTTPDLSLRPQGFGGNLSNFFGRQGFNMPQRHGGDMPMISSGGFDPASGKFSPPKDQYGNPVTKPMRDPMRPMVGRMAPEQNLTPAQQTDFEQQRLQQNAYLSQFTPTQEEIARNTALYGGNRNAEGGMGGGRMVGFDPMIQQQRAQEQEQLRQQGITPINPNDRIFVAGAINPFSDADMGKYNQISAERNMAEAAARANQPPASMETLASTLRGMGGGSQPGPRMQEYVPPKDQRPPNPYAQQVRQEDPRMRAMRNMQRMNFGGGGGYNF
jgi:hypothetical protein